MRGKREDRGGWRITKYKSFHAVNDFVLEPTYLGAIQMTLVLRIYCRSMMQGCVIVIALFRYAGRFILCNYETSCILIKRNTFIGSNWTKLNHFKKAIDFFSTLQKVFFCQASSKMFDLQQD